MTQEHKSDLVESADDAGSRPITEPAAPPDAAGEQADGSLPQAAPRKRGPRPAPIMTLLVIVALSLGALASAAAGFLWWQYRQFYVALSSEDSNLEQGLEQLRSGQRRQDDRLGDLRDALDGSARRLDSVADELGPLRSDLAALAQRVDALQGRSLDVRTLWLRSEAEYYLAAANTELEVAGNWDGAIRALELADRLLRELGNPSFSQVRAAIADELQALRAVALPDLEGLAYSLGSLAARVRELPLRAEGPTRFGADAPEIDAVEPGLGRLWLGLKQAVLGIVRIERRDDPVQVVLSEAERRLLRTRVELELEIARTALLRSQPDAFVAALEAAARMLEQDFDTTAQGVAGALRLLDEMRRLDIAPSPPDISRSLNLLRAVPESE